MHEYLYFSAGCDARINLLASTSACTKLKSLQFAGALNCLHASIDETANPMQQALC